MTRTETEECIRLSSGPLRHTFGSTNATPIGLNTIGSITSSTPPGTIMMSIAMARSPTTSSGDCVKSWKAKKRPSRCSTSTCNPLQTQPLSHMMNALPLRSSLRTRGAILKGTGGFATLIEMVSSSRMTSTAASARSLTSRTATSTTSGT